MKVVASPRGALLIALLAGAGCSSDTPPEPVVDEETGAVAPADAQPQDIPVRLRGTVRLSGYKTFSQGTAREGASYTHNLNVDCEFTQPAVMWTDAGTEYFRLVESEPGVLTSQFEGTVRATGDGHVIDLNHEPKLSEKTEVRLGGPLSTCLIRQLDEARFGEGYDITIDMEAALTGSVKSTTQSGDAVFFRNTAGSAMPMGVEPVNEGPEGTYALHHEPGNGMHLAPSPLLLRPALGPRPEGSGPEVELKQQVYDGLVAHPNLSWVGLKFDPRARVWTFEGSNTTLGGDQYKLSVRIAVEL